MKRMALLSMLLLTLVISMAGCTEEKAVLTPAPTPTPEPTPTATPTAAPNATPKPTSTTTPKSTPTPTLQALFLRLTQPVDGIQVSTSSISVVGKTIPSAVVSVSVDETLEIADVDPNGNFSVRVTLEEGPNLIEVIASDQQGNEKSASIAVIYIP